LLGDGPDGRKAWIDNHVRELAQIFSVAVGGFSVLDKQLHVLALLDPEVARRWSDEDVLPCWGLHCANGQHHLLQCGVSGLQLGIRSGMNRDRGQPGRQRFGQNIAAVVTRPSATGR
jgi:hypothetical protein